MWWLCFTCVEEKLEQNLVRKPLLLTLMTTPSSCSPIIVIQISISSFTFTGFFLPHQFSLDYRGITYGTSNARAGQRNNQGWKDPGQSEDWILSHKVTKSYFN